MRNLKYIFAISSLVLSTYVFSYNTSFCVSNKIDNNTSSENSNNELLNEITDQKTKENIINSYNNYYSSDHSFTIKNSNLTSYKSKNPISLILNGNLNLTSNALCSYIFNINYSYNSITKNYTSSFGDTSYSVIEYNDKVYLFSANEELKGVFSFPSSLDSSLPVVNEESSFSSIFKKFLNLESNNTSIVLNDSSYTFIGQNFKIETDKNYNFKKIESTKDEDFKYIFNFSNNYDNKASSISLDTSNTDFVSTLKSLLKESSFLVELNANITSKTSKNIKFNGDLKLDYTSSVLKSGPIIDLNITQYTDNNYANKVRAYYDDSNIYFQLDNILKGKISDATINDLISVTSGVLSDSSFDYTFNKSLNSLMNTSTFDSIFKLDFSSLDSSLIKNLEINHNLISFKLDSKAFNLNNGYIRFEIGLNNLKVKTLKIKDFKIDNDKTMECSLNFKDFIKINELQDKDTYDSYDSILPFYKNILRLSKNSNIGGSFSTSLIDSNSSSTLGLSSNYNIDYKNALTNSNVNDLKVALDNLNINYIDETDENKISNTVNAIFLENTLSSSKSSFNLSIDSLNYQNKTFYLELIDSSKSYKYTLENESISTLINSINKLNLNKQAIATLPSTDKGFNKIKNQIKRIDYLIYFLENNSKFINIINKIKNTYSLEGLEDYITITPESNNKFKLEFNLYSLVNYDETIIKEYSLNNYISIELSSSGEIISLNVYDLALDGITSSTKITLKDYDSSKVLTEDQIKNLWTNEKNKENKSKNLNSEVERISNIVDCFNKYYLNNATLSNLINIEFAYKDLTLNGNIASLLHFNEDKELDEKYIEASLPITFSKSSSEKDVTGLNVDLIYSDKDLEESNFKNLVYDEYRLKKGTQANIQLKYGDNPMDSRNFSTIYAYSSLNTMVDCFEALSNIDDNSILMSYSIINQIKNISTQIVNSINGKDSNFLKSLADLGIINKNTLISLLNGLNSSTNKLTLTFDFKDFASNKELSKYKFNIDINLTTAKDLKDNTFYRLDSIEAKEANHEDINLKIKIAETRINFDSLSSGNKLSKDIFTLFIPYNRKPTWFMDISYLANILELGVRITNKRYYEMSGTFNLKDNIAISIPTLLSKDLEITEIQPINEITFELKLFFYKEYGTDEAYKIKSYLKLQNNEDSNEITEFFIDPSKVYLSKYSKNNSTNEYESNVSYITKETLLGYSKVTIMNIDNNGKEVISDDTRKVPRILYYLLDYSTILNSKVFDVEYATIELHLNLKNVILSSLFDVMTDTSNKTESKQDIQIDYLSGWEIHSNKDSSTSLIKGYFLLDLSQMVLGFDLGDINLDFKSKLKLSFEELTTDFYKFILSQADDKSNLLEASFTYGDITIKISLKIENSQFILTTSNNYVAYSLGFSRYTSFITEFDKLMISDEYYITNIISPDIKVEYTFPITVYITSNYRVEFNNPKNQRTFSYYF